MKLMDLPRKSTIFIRLFVQNFNNAKTLRPIAGKSADKYLFVGMERADFFKFRFLYFMASGKKLNLFQFVLSWLYSDRLVMCCIEKSTNRLIGAEIYYFNQRDLDNSTIHQGYRMIHHSYQGMGIGTMLTKYSLRHFKSQNLQGVSSRVKSDNMSSLKSNLKSGFKIAETFKLPNGVDEYYLVAYFNSKEVE